MTTQGLIKRLERFEASIEGYTRSEIETRSEWLITQNKRQIYSESITHKAKPIINKRFNAPIYSKRYEAYKRRRGLFQGHIDLHLSGKYLNSLKVELRTDEFEIRGYRMVKGFDLAAHLRKWFPDAEGLTDDNISDFREIYLRPRLLREAQRI